MNSESTGSTGGTRKKLLIVDDDPDVFELVRPILEEYRFDCLGAASATEGVEKAIAHQPNLILLDLMLPAMSGFGFMLELKRRCPFPIPVVVYTQLRDELVAREILDMGAAGYVTKTFDPDKLAQIIEKYAQ